MSDIGEAGQMPLLEPNGCLRLEAMCFIDELEQEQRAVVQGHVQECSLCAQQQAGLTRAVERMRRASPEVIVPLEVRMLAHQAMIHAIQKGGMANPPTALGDRQESCYDGLDEASELLIDRTAQLPRPRPLTPPARHARLWIYLLLGCCIALSAVLLWLLR